MAKWVALRLPVRVTDVTSVSETEHWMLGYINGCTTSLPLLAASTDGGECTQYARAHQRPVVDSL